MDLPAYIQIEPVGQCNLRCTMCSLQFRKDGPPYGPPAFMQMETFYRIVDGNPNLNHLHLQGLGEPMMHPRFFEMVSYAAGRGIRVTTNSNVTLLNDRRAEQAIASGLHDLYISIGASLERLGVSGVPGSAGIRDPAGNLRLLLDLQGHVLDRRAQVLRG